MPKITVLPHHQICPTGAEIELNEGDNLCRGLLEKGVKIEHACDMSKACTTCHVIVRKGFNSLEEMDDIEADLLDRYLKMHPTIKRPIVVRELRKRMMEDDNSSAAGFRGINTLIHQFFSEKNYPITPAKGRFVDFAQ